MAQQTINIGAAANDGTGDSIRDAFNKTNDNFDELYAFDQSIADVYVSQESEFPVQDATTITLESKKRYVYTADITTAKRFVCEAGSLITANNLEGAVLTYTGTGSMFTGSDANWTINEATISCPSAIAFDFNDTVGGQSVIRVLNVTINECAQVADFDNVRTVVTNNFACEDADQGIQLSGSSWLIFSATNTALISTSASFKGIDFQSSVNPNIELANLVCIGPAGSFGISGLANSGNVPTGFLAMVRDSSFSGGMTPLENITNSDIRWKFTDNTPVGDTIEDCLISMNGNATATTIGASGTPVLVAGTWVCERESLFTCTTGGRATYDGERDKPLPIDACLSLSPSSGTNKDLKAYFALNGTVIANSGKQIRVDSGNPLMITLFWQRELSEDDYLEVFVENNTDNTNIVVRDAILRVN